MFLLWQFIPLFIKHSCQRLYRETYAETQYLKMKLIAGCHGDGDTQGFKWYFGSTRQELKAQLWGTDWQQSVSHVSVSHVDQGLQPEREEEKWEFITFKYFCGKKVLNIKKNSAVCSINCFVVANEVFPKIKIFSTQERYKTSKLFDLLLCELFKECKPM